MKFYITEIIKIYSDFPSFFSKKRIESGIAFACAEIGLMMFLFIHINSMTISDIVLWASLQFTISGYILHKIQAEKTK